MLLRNWHFKQSDNQEWLPASVPGCVHTDLLANKKIADPFYGTNELDLQWIDKQDWEYETIFDIPDHLMNTSRLHLVFNGLDTYADVYLNDEKILEANNMFRTWQADVKALVKKEKNRLTVFFRSPIKEDLPKLEKLGYDLPAGNDHSEDGGLGDKKVSIFARKAPYHYGWDWGPRFVTSGIWKEVQLEGWTTCKITDLFIHQKEITASSASLSAKVEIESDGDWQGHLQLSTEGILLEKEVYLKSGQNFIELDIEILNPKLWWSRGLGEQHQYEFSVLLHNENHIVAEKSVKAGLRSVKLIREKDSEGSSFYLELNGVPVFAKGANHIPNDSFVTEISYERYKHEIISAVEANMNMLRIWGGGIYEYDEFYDLCDEYGITVWQDFMFACSMYPGDEAFLQNVKIEAEETIKRLRNHPSVVLWCGNNEMDTAWSEYIDHAGWGWKEQYSPEIRKKIWSDYEAIFHRILPDAVDEYAPAEDYWPSSPMNDWTGDENQHASFTTTSGDIHYWDVWHGSKPFEDYNTHVGRFMSEYGFQSFPELKTVHSYAEEKDLALESEIMLHHQKNVRGNQLIKEYMEAYCPAPKDFPGFLYMSQVLQAEGIKVAIEAHRRRKPYCMGTLYWQMNDCWPVASWSSMDYYGRWKALHYYGKKSFQDVILSIEAKEKSLDIYVVSDQLSQVVGNVTIELYDFDGQLLLEETSPVTISPNSSTVVKTIQVDELLNDRNRSNVVLRYVLDQDEKVIDSKEYYFVPSKELVLKPPAISMELVESSEGAEWILTTDVLAKQVWLSTETEGIFTDNYFDLIPGLPKKVRFKARKQDENPEKIEVRSMADFI
ncbi:beta-galactosidase [Bacillus sp. SA1-12]|uniref:beta-mannosidase n=1 Tax=Bacillus sp. SA1-12 TaxID=1455638 RepID=UPI0006272F65|nr:glycoside hydrolase family 2 protein [Bacillus sp. SA1-12]KKI89164.1 beta-galactosidase [Bacillus sp. SA1-12]